MVKYTQQVSLHEFCFLIRTPVFLQQVLIFFHLDSKGGVEESNCLSSIEKFNPKTGAWTSFSALPRMMCGSGMQVLDSVPLSLAHPSRRRKAPYFDSGLVSAGMVTSAPAAATETSSIGGLPTVEAEAFDFYPTGVTVGDGSPSLIIN